MPAGTTHRAAPAPAFSRWMEVASPLGPLRLTGNGDALTGVYMSPHRHGPVAFPDDLAGEDEVLRRAAVQLAEYFEGRRRVFDVPLSPVGSEFQRRVWCALLEIPFGETRTYTGLARMLDGERLVRAVGAANGRNPISIIIPCHRVVGADGSLVGFGGGLPRKRWLLTHELRVTGVTLAQE